MSTDLETKTTTKTAVKFPSRYKVVLHNDNYTPMNFVTQVLVELFHKPVDEAEMIMMTVHKRGRAVVNTYSKEVAFQKVTEVQRVAEAYGHPLLATAEEDS